MATFTVKRLDSCCLKVMGIGWRNILFVEYDMVNSDYTVDPTPYHPTRSVGVYDGIRNYIDENGISFEHSIQSVPYWVVTDGGNDGNAQFTPKIPFTIYDPDTETFSIDAFKINIETSDNASQQSGRTLDMSFKCEYEGIEELDDHHVGRGTDDNQIWGHYMFEGDVMPYLYADNCSVDGLGAVSSGVVFYGGNYNSYYNENLKYPFMCPILAIQGTKSHPLSIALLGWGFMDPYYKQHDHLEPGFQTTSHIISSQFFDYGVEGNVLEDFLWCTDADLISQFINNTLFIRFGQWQEDIDPFDGWGDPDEDTPKGGDGDGMLPDEVVEPTVPNVACWNGFFTCYKLTKGQLDMVADFCWSTDLWDTMKKFYTSPSEAVLGLMFVPFAPRASDSKEIYFGNIPTGVTAGVVGAQFQRKDMGSIFIKEATKSYLDFAPYSKYQIFLPFIGIRDLDADDIVGKNLGVMYCLDMLSGACVAHVTVNGSVRYSFSGQCGIMVPVTSQNLGQSVMSAATAAASIGIGVMTGGASFAAGAATGAAAGLSNASGSVGGLASMVSSSKPSISHGGAMGAGGGWLGPGKPFLITTYPNICTAHQQQALEGYPTFRGSTVGSFSGYTQFEALKLKATKATQEEQEEIIRLLKAGVFV